MRIWRYVIERPDEGDEGIDGAEPTQMGANSGACH